MASQPVISNTTPLIALAYIGRLDLLPQMFRSIWIPQAVYDEVLHKPQAPGTDELATASWLQLVPIQDRLAVSLLRDQLGAGESEAIVLAREQNAALLLMDEQRGQRRAIHNGLNVVGTQGILIQAKRRGLLGPLRPVLDQLQRLPFHMSEQLYSEVLRQVGE
ncbi:DUF3368 domain-containing protein [Candidatus Chloroploca sp. Khr17]|uniref:DUF3368 domain-containing protein n=1 Tax=Candidatus Chloroploca sp. Khr17 TaxID=2496869 RepID=UPI00101C5B9E|nr:DUF3368 domain-containing protein [Candidatus Chloroploca sp. Khr17]